MNLLRAYDFGGYATSSLAWQKRFQPLGRAITVELRTRDIKHERFPLVAVGCRLNPVKPQINDRGRHRRTLIAVNEWMIATNVKQIGSRHLGQVREGRFTAVRCLGSG